MTPVQIKICGVTNLRDARACAELGANMVGFNFYSKSPRYIEPAAARPIVEAMPPGVCTVGVFVDASADEIRNIAAAARVQCLQLYGPTSPDTCSELVRDFRVIRAFSIDYILTAIQISSLDAIVVLVFS